MTETKQVPVEWREAVQEFVDRCDRGLVRSSYTYDKFKRLLAAAPATEPSDVERLAVEIADEAAIQSIACECSHHYMDDGVTWADTSYASDNDVDLGPDLRYLELRGLLEHHPDHPEWVRVKEQKS